MALRTWCHASDLLSHTHTYLTDEGASPSLLQAAAKDLSDTDQEQLEAGREGAEQGQPAGQAEGQGQSQALGQGPGASTASPLAESYESAKQRSAAGVRGALAGLGGAVQQALGALAGGRSPEQQLGATQGEGQEERRHEEALPEQPAAGKGERGEAQEERREETPTEQPAAREVQHGRGEGKEAPAEQPSQPAAGEEQRGEGEGKEASAEQPAQSPAGQAQRGRGEGEEAKQAAPEAEAPWRPTGEEEDIPPVYIRAGWVQPLAEQAKPASGAAEAGTTAGSAGGAAQQAPGQETGGAEQAPTGGEAAYQFSRGLATTSEYGGGVGGGGAAGGRAGGGEASEVQSWYEAGRRRAEAESAGKKERAAPEKVGGLGCNQQVLGCLWCVRLLCSRRSLCGPGCLRCVMGHSDTACNASSGKVLAG